MPLTYTLELVIVYVCTFSLLRAQDCLLLVLVVFFPRDAFAILIRNENHIADLINVLSQIWKDD